MLLILNGVDNNFEYCIAKAPVISKISDHIIVIELVAGRCGEEGTETAWLYKDCQTSLFYFEIRQAHQRGGQL